MNLFRTKDLSCFKAGIGSCNRANSRYRLLYTWCTNKIYLANPSNQSCRKCPVDRLTKLFTLFRTERSNATPCLAVLSRIGHNYKGIHTTRADPQNVQWRTSKGPRKVFFNYSIQVNSLNKTSADANTRPWV